MNHFEFEYPYALALLPLIICIYKCPLPFMKRLFVHIDLFQHTTHWFNRQRLLYSLIATLLIIALATPISYTSKTLTHKKGRDLVFVLDTSGSMAESGFSKEKKYATKFTIVQNTLQRFITHRFEDNVGVSVFGSYALSVIPLSYDMHSVSFLLPFLEVGMVGENTAIGDGIHQALKLLKKSNAKNKVIILLTDGHQNSGSFSIKQELLKANTMKVRIYTIGLGKRGDFDATLLQHIAQQTNAKMFQASNASTLTHIYKELNRLEPSPLRSPNYLHKHMLFEYPLAGAILLSLFLLSREKGIV